MLKQRDLPVKINTVITRDKRRNSGADASGPLDKPDFHSIILLRGEPMSPTVALPPLEELHRLGPEIFKILETYDTAKAASPRICCGIITAISGIFPCRRSSSSGR